MQAVTSPVRQARAHYRHELRTLTYVTLDAANGGIIRNLTDEGVAIQAVAALHPHQIVRVRFELRHPRLRVEARAEVMWAHGSGQCGIRFLDLSPAQARHINEWIFGNLLASIPRHSARGGSIFATVIPISEIAGEDDGLLVSSASRKVIQLEPLSRADPLPEKAVMSADVMSADDAIKLDWLSRPVSGRTLAWAVDGLIVLAAMLLFSLVFLSVARELPKRPWIIALSAALFATVSYWGFFKAFAGATLGKRLTRLIEDDQKDQESVGSRFR